MTTVALTATHCGLPGESSIEDNPVSMKLLQNVLAIAKPCGDKQERNAHAGSANHSVSEILKCSIEKVNTSATLSAEKSLGDKFRRNAITIAAKCSTETTISHNKGELPVAKQFRVDAIMDHTKFNQVKG